MEGGRCNTRVKHLPGSATTPLTLPKDPEQKTTQAHRHTPDNRVLWLGRVRSNLREKSRPLSDGDHQGVGAQGGGFQFPSLAHPGSSSWGGLCQALEREAKGAAEAHLRSP